MNTLISRGCLFVNYHLLHIAPLCIPKASKFQKGVTIWINYDEQILIIQDTIESNRQETDEKKINTDEKLTNITEDLKVFTATITSMMDQINN